MALAHLENIQLQALPSHPLVGSAVVTYDAISDELAFWMGGDPRPHISEPANAFVSILFDLESGVAIGVHVENFLAWRSISIQGSKRSPVTSATFLALKTTRPVPLAQHPVSRWRYFLRYENDSSIL